MRFWNNNNQVRSVKLLETHIIFKKKGFGSNNPKGPKQDSQIRLRLLMTKGDWPPLKKTLF